ncbi:MAG: Y-family DNA polymerase [Clostridiales bacterium]|nr:Y-family DNA polymerase [Clostridiales bacterium]
MNQLYPKRNILCIDLKSFFASCECIERGLDPFKTPLVVANPNQGNGAITLAVTPYLKKQGVKSRGRLFEIDRNIKYTIAKPRMNLYVAKSKEVIGIYLDFISDEDLLVYSIDECFLDVTNYLKMYKKTDKELAMEILDTIRRKTGLTATCGIGPNMLLAKVSMDIEAKHNENNIAKWTYDDIKDKLWNIKPLSDMWGIGPRMEKNLNRLGIYSIKDLAKYDKYSLKDKFGIMGIELWNHANGIDLSIINDFKKIAKSESFSHSQVLFKNYNEDNIKIIISEMVDVLAARLRKHNKQALCIGLGIGYSKEINDGFYHSIKIDNPTDSAYDILNYCLIIFDKFYNNFPIRKVTVSCSNLKKKENHQLNLFETEQIKEEINNVNLVIDQIKEKYGKNSVLKATNLLDDSTAIERNKKTGGHYS